MEIRDLDAELARAISDYIATSQSAGLYGRDGYMAAEEQAWERLTRALAACGYPVGDGRQ